MTGAAASGTDRRVLTAGLKQEAIRLGFEAAGIARLRPSDHQAFYRAWLEAGMHGEMAYLSRADAVQARLDPASRWPDLRTALVVTLRYTAPDDDIEAAQPAPSRAIIARYARGRDYHKILKKKLLALLAWLEAETGRPLPAARAYVDTGPVLERELARRAGLGWFGRNTMILHPRRGSYFFLGTLLTELDLEADEPFERDHCGTCNACVEACPTGALLGRDAAGAPVMDARRCISYLTIENRGPIPRELRPLIGNRVFGCDICQEVCPWNGAGAGNGAGRSSLPRGPDGS
ncbi:MAG: tRNA epoxyqueuosine(34) reductase QueG, partial [Longimicrobiales bacterium]